MRRGGIIFCMNLMKTLLRSVVAGGAIMWLTTAGLADSGDYKPPVAKGELPWMAIFYAVACTGVICFIAFRNSKRSHLD